MSKFKKGDVITGIGDYYPITNSDSKCLILDINSLSVHDLYVEVIDHKCKEMIGQKFSVASDYFELYKYEKKQEIHITTDGRTVHAVMKENGKLVKRSKAVCSTEDDFNLYAGVNLAVTRLLY